MVTGNVFAIVPVVNRSSREPFRRMKEEVVVMHFLINDKSFVEKLMSFMV